jgi:YD repeat-containing protein
MSIEQKRSDPVWGAMAAERGSSTFSTPNGLLANASIESSAVLSDLLDPLSLISRAETATVNGRTYTAIYEAVFRRWTMTSPEGRQRIVETDPFGRPTSIQVGDLLPITFSYDTRGRLEAIRQGTGADERLVEFGYDSLGRLASVTDPLMRQVLFAYDSANRVRLQSLPGGRDVLFDWDDKGNLTSLTPPGRPVHGFSYTPVDRTDVYSPPSLGLGTWSTDYDYALDRKPLTITRPDGLEIGFGYDAARRLEAIISPRGTTEIDYDPVTGHVERVTSPEGNALVNELDGPLVTRTTWAGEVAGSVERTYDNDLRVSSISVNGANPVAYLYDDDGLITRAGDLLLTRDPATGVLTDTELGVVTTHYEYSDFGELAAMTASVSSTPVFETSYIRDKLGRITTKVEMIEGVTTTYVYAFDAGGPA